MSTISSSPLFADFRPRTQTQGTAAALLCLSNYRLRTEATSDEPRLRILVGHIAVYDQARDWCRSNLRSADLGLHKSFEENDEDCDDLVEENDIYSEENNRWSSFDSDIYEDHLAPEDEQETTNELQDYLHQIPSLQDFQEAIRQQLATVAEVTASFKAQSTEEVQSYSVDTDSDDTDYESYDSSFDEDEDSASDSASSATDVDLIESWSMCSSPVQPEADLHNLDDDKVVEIWAIQHTADLVACAA